MSYKNYFLWFRFRVNLSLGDATATGLWNNSHFQSALSFSHSLFLFISFSLSQLGFILNHSCFYPWYLLMYSLSSSRYNLSLPFSSASLLCIVVVSALKRGKVWKKHHYKKSDSRVILLSSFWDLFQLKINDNCLGKS